MPQLEEQRRRNREKHRRWRERNGDKERERLRRYYAAHAEEERARSRKRKHDERRVSTQTKEWREILAQDHCSYCGAASELTDHIEPLSANGSREWENLTAACGQCNSHKHAEPLLRFLLREDR